MEVIDFITHWAQENVLVVIFLGFFFREAARFVVKKTPTKYDDIGFEILEGAIMGALRKVRGVRSKKTAVRKKRNHARRPDQVQERVHKDRSRDERSDR